MANLPETASYDAGVTQLETATLVLGGVDGPANTPLRNLANRTKWLKVAVDAIQAALPFLAPLNSPALTGSPTAPTTALGEDSTKLATMAAVHAAEGGVVIVPCGGGGNVTLSAAQWGAATLVLSGAVGAPINVIFPARGDRWQVVNLTTGATVTCKTPAAAGVVVSPGRARQLFCDGVTLGFAEADFRDVALTGTPTAPTPPADDNGTTVPNTSWIRALIAGLGSGSGTIINNTTFAQPLWRRLFEGQS